jgi:hypothetical protein
MYQIQWLVLRPRRISASAVSEPAEGLVWALWKRERDMEERDQ